MAGDTTTATELLTSTTDSRSRMRGEVAVLLQRTDLLSPSAVPETRARAAWAHGDLSGAIAVLEAAGKGGSRYARRLRSEFQLLSPGYHLPDARRGAGTSTASEGTPLRVLHVLTNSLPHTQSGYSLRTHRILTALREQGIESVAITRTGYPVMIGKPFAADEDVVDGIRYVRTLPSRLPQTQEERLMAEVARALELVEKFRPHAIHATTNYYNALVAQAVSAATGLPWILEVRGLMEKTWAASLPIAEGRAAAAVSEKSRLVAAREAELATAADAVVTLSQTMVDELEARGVATERIVTVPNSVDGALLDENLSPREARALLGMGVEDSFLVGAVSALVDYEGFDTLLRAAALIIHGTLAPEQEQMAAGVHFVQLRIAHEACSTAVDATKHLKGRQDNLQQSLLTLVNQREDAELLKQQTYTLPDDDTASGTLTSYTVLDTEGMLNATPVTSSLAGKKRDDAMRAIESNLTGLATMHEMVHARQDRQLEAFDTAYEEWEVAAGVFADSLDGVLGVLKDADCGKRLPARWVVR